MFTADTIQRGDYCIINNGVEMKKFRFNSVIKKAYRKKSETIFENTITREVDVLKTNMFVPLDTPVEDWGGGCKLTSRQLDRKQAAGEIGE